MTCLFLYLISCLLSSVLDSETPLEIDSVHYHATGECAAGHTLTKTHHEGSEGIHQRSQASTCQHYYY